MAAAIRLAVVDDSTFVRMALRRILEREPSIKLVGEAATGEELLKNLGKWRPEVITLDLNMPGIGGLATLDRIMAWRNVPVIILSTHSSKDAPLTIEALHRGAVDFIDKQQYSLVDFDALRKVLIEKVTLVTGRADTAAAPAPQRREAKPVPIPAPPVHRKSGNFGVVVIGASTGGPPAIQQILERLVTPIPVPVVIVQHMPEGFTEAFASRLNSRLSFPVLTPVHGQEFEAGSVYIASAGAHLHLQGEPGYLEAVTTRFPEKVSHRPSVDVMFRSAARLAESGVRSLAVLLTGMGKDGAEGLAELHRCGAHTLAQNESTCIVWGMPKAALDLGAVMEELPLPAIASRINELLPARSGARETSA